MNKPWLRAYPPGLAESVSESPYASLADFFRDRADLFRDRPAVTGLGRTLSYAELDALSRQFAAFLRQGLQLDPGERIALMLPNIPQQPVAFWGALRAGLVVVNVNPLYTARELEHQLRDSGAAVLVVLENFAGVAAEVLTKLRLKAVILARLGDLLAFPRRPVLNWYGHWTAKVSLAEAIAFSEVLREGARLVFEPVTARRDDLALIQYTGGTTGIAKGVMLSHGNLLANVEQCHTWITAGLPPERRLVAGEEAVLTALPLYHIFALTVQLLCFTRIGGLNRLVVNPRDLPGLVRMLKRQRCTVLVGVNTLFKGLLATPGFAGLDFSALKLVIAGGMAVEPTVARHWLDTTGCAITEGYGLTEAAPVVAINLPGAEVSGAVGLPLPDTDCDIRDDLGWPVTPGRAGELWVRGPQVMAGYWNRPLETSEALTSDGWLRTGDIARMDERGFLFLMDRKKDMVLVSGFSVYPAEIEAVLSAHPAVRECAAIGVRDEHSGEAVKVFVVPSLPGLDAETVRRYCRANLAGYKVPKYVEFRDELPKTLVGKILRRELRKSA